jgi:hypothetical protein
MEPVCVEIVKFVRPDRWQWCVDFENSAFNRDGEAPTLAGAFAAVQAIIQAPA